MFGGGQTDWWEGGHGPQAPMVATALIMNNTRTSTFQCK